MLLFFMSYLVFKMYNADEEIVDTTERSKNKDIPVVGGNGYLNRNLKYIFNKILKC